MNVDSHLEGTRDAAEFVRCLVAYMKRCQRGGEEGEEMSTVEDMEKVTEGDARLLAQHMLMKISGVGMLNP